MNGLGNAGVVRDLDIQVSTVKRAVKSLASASLVSE